MTMNMTATQASALPRAYMSADLRAATGLSRTHLDYYLRAGLVRPVARTQSGFLLFDESECAIVRQIIAWRHDGLTLREIGQRLGRPLESAS